MIVKGTASKSTGASVPFQNGHNSGVRPQFPDNHIGIVWGRVIYWLGYRLVIKL
jgi:hypothetical protein